MYLRLEKQIKPENYFGAFVDLFRNFSIWNWIFPDGIGFFSERDGEIVEISRKWVNFPKNIQILQINMYLNSPKKNI